MEITNRTCHVKIIVNPTATTSFALRFEKYPKSQVNLKITIPHVSDLQSMVDDIKKEIPLKFNFNVQFNWKNVPPSIKDDKKFQEDILKIFSVGPNIEYLPKPIGSISATNIITSDADNSKLPKADYSKLAALVKLHNDQYGATPDFKNNVSDKGKLKIHNHIKTVLGMPKLTMEQTLHIADIVLKNEKN